MENSTDISVKVSTLPRGVKRLDELRKYFIEEYGLEPEYFVKVPGRVNIIGEHVDYCGYPVLPMALEQNILVAVSVDKYTTKLQLANVNPKYKSFECDVNSFEIVIGEGSPEWYKYFLCGVKGVIEHSSSAEFQGMKVLVSGNIPPASGLSSSSALVSAATLTTSYANKLSLNKQRLAEISAKSEWYIGTQGGGMDQAIAFLAQEGCAQFIDWNPLTATPITLPENAVFVIANSLSQANKAATNDFNQRVVECRVGCSIIAKSQGLLWKKFIKFATLQKELDISLDQLHDLANNILKKDNYTLSDIVSILQIEDNEFQETFLSSNTKDMQAFNLRNRALHVLQESIRVQKFCDLCRSSGSIADLSVLMRQSHLSLNVQYECSHPKLNELVGISDKFGVGARLTGAGWGGCIVALCESKEHSQKFIQELKEKYYKKLPESELNFENVVFATSPQSGAEIFAN
ncbi:N-acetylgalactosamine kinase [Pseudolycoriella hygida]|uniref:N-acetylgalactosamine kinase n=1 Tax=Pseudolycoriella hygida TaxID=35572 RepID=A0A9Q0N304_9DIPT|nr:N-acetylgalactosamine kinase [Pseudolycoriella hygida]